MTRVSVAIGLIARDGRYFLQRRDPGAAVLPGLWEFPGGKLEPGEAPEAGLLRELQEEVRTRPERVTPLRPVLFRYPDREVRLFAFLCLGGATPRTSLAWGWFSPGQMAALPMPEANRELLRILAAGPAPGQITGNST